MKSSAAPRAFWGRPSVVAAAGVVLIVACAVAGFVLQHVAGGHRVATDVPTVLALAVGSLGCLIGWQKPGNRVGPLLGFTGAAFAIAALGAGLLDYGALRGGIPRPVEQVAYAWIWVTGTLVCAWALFILWFPDGHLSSPAWRRYLVVATGICVPFVVACYLFAPAGQVYTLFSGTVVPPGVAGPFATPSWKVIVDAGHLILLVPLIALVGLVQRYRHADAVVRQQIKWLVGGAITGVLSQVVGVLLTTVGGAPQVVGDLLGGVGQPMVAVGAAIAILRYRLWDIDLVVSRAVVFGVVWTALSALLLVPALAAGLLVGGSSALTAVGLALLVTMLFRPAMRRLEGVVSRLVYRRGERPHVVLTGFWEKLRRTATLDELGDLLTVTVRSGLRVPRVGVWVCDATTLRPVGTTGSELEVTGLSPSTAAILRASPGVVLGGELPGELVTLWGEPPDAVVPLVAGDELVGMLACGRRRGDRLGAADFELLELLARESAQRLRNLRLEARLRDRVVEIEAQSMELRRSRQRLVTVQDEERRRIERNLHDGVQQQLVSLAIRLKRVAAGGDPELADLAVEAEQVVFELQELGRGIFPTVLVDQGLAAALRTAIARMPMVVHIDVRPDVLRCRLQPDVEAALYFVALEALTNAQKHAAAPEVSVLLHTEGDQLVLEVVDDGRGFRRERQRGTGLLNMSDRMAAAGGHLDIESSVGAGTKIVASVPSGDDAQLPDPRRPSAEPHLPNADSRR